MDEGRMNDLTKDVSADLRGRLALRINEAAAALGVSPNTFRRMLTYEGLPCIRTGNVVLIPVEPLRAWLAEQARSQAGQIEETVENALRKVSA